MSGKAYLIYSDDYLSYRLAEDHPLNPQRYALTVELMKIAEVLKDDEIIPPRPATLKELYLVHDPAYVEAVMKLSKRQPLWPGFGRQSGFFRDARSSGAGGGRFSQRSGNDLRRRGRPRF